MNLNGFLTKLAKALVGKGATARDIHLPESLRELKGAPKDLAPGAPAVVVRVSPTTTEATLKLDLDSDKFSSFAKRYRREWNETGEDRSLVSDEEYLRWVQEAYRDSVAASIDCEIVRQLVELGALREFFDIDGQDIRWLFVQHAPGQGEGDQVSEWYVKALSDITLLRTTLHFWRLLSRTGNHERLILQPQKEFPLLLAKALASHGLNREGLEICNEMKRVLAKKIKVTPFEPDLIKLQALTLIDCALLHGCLGNPNEMKQSVDEASRLAEELRELSGANPAGNRFETAATQIEIAAEREVNRCHLRHAFRHSEQQSPHSDQDSGLWSQQIAEDLLDSLEAFDARLPMISEDQPLPEIARPLDFDTAARGFLLLSVIRVTANRMLRPYETEGLRIREEEAAQSQHSVPDGLSVHQAGYLLRGLSRYEDAEKCYEASAVRVVVGNKVVNPWTRETLNVTKAIKEIACGQLKDADITIGLIIRNQSLFHSVPTIRALQALYKRLEVKSGKG
jgi:hypothetical protein